MKKTLLIVPDSLGPDLNELWGFSRGPPVQKARNKEVAGSFWTGSSGSKSFGYYFPESLYYKYKCVRWASTENQVEKLYNFEMYFLIEYPSANLQRRTRTKFPMYAHPGVFYDE